MTLWNTGLYLLWAQHQSWSQSPFELQPSPTLQIQLWPTLRHDLNSIFEFLLNRYNEVLHIKLIPCQKATYQTTWQTHPFLQDSHQSLNLCHPKSLKVLLTPTKLVTSSYQHASKVVPTTQLIPLIMIPPPLGMDGLLVQFWQPPHPVNPVSSQQIQPTPWPTQPTSTPVPSTHWPTS